MDDVREKRGGRGGTVNKNMNEVEFDTKEVHRRECIEGNA